jgi:hypothetical protein
MNLHLRVLIGYYTLIGLLVFCAVGAGLSFNHLGDSLSHNLAERPLEAQAKLSLLAGLDQHDAMLRRALNGDLAARAELPKGWTELEAAAGGQGEPSVDATDAERDLRWSLAHYRQVAEERLAASALEPDETKVLEAFRTLKAQVYRALEENLRATVEREGEVEIRARRYATIYATVLALILIVVAFLSRQLRRGLLDRLVATATVAQAVADGDRSRRADDGPDDELGIISHQLNALLDTELALHAEMEGRLCQQRQLLLGVLQSWPKKVAVFTIYGDLAVTTLDEKERDPVVAAEIDFPASPAKVEEDQPFTARIGERELRFRLLRVDGRRPVGWLAEVD